MKICRYILLFSLFFNLNEMSSQSSNDNIGKLIKNEKFEKALTLLNKTKLNTMDYNRYKGIIYYGLYNPDSTIYYLNKSYRNNIKDDEVLIKLSQALLWKKKLKDAAPLLKKVRDKSNVEYLKVLASKHEILGEYSKANSLYDRVIKNEKLPYGTMERKAIVLSWMKQYDNSIKLLDKIISTKIVSKALRIRCMMKKAEILSWKMKFDKAITVLNKVLKIDKKNTHARSLKELILSEKNDDFLINTSQQLLWQKNFKDATPLLEQVRDKTNLKYLKVLASKHELLREYKKAILLYDRVIKMEKLPYKTMERKAIVLSWMKQYDASISLFDKIINTKKASQTLQIRSKIEKAEVLSWKKEFDKAIKILDAVLRTDVKNIQARFVKAQILEWQGKYKTAKNIYKEVLLIDHNNKEAKRKLEKLLWVK